MYTSFFKKLIITSILLSLVVIPNGKVFALWGEGDTIFDPIQDQSGISTQIAQITQVVGLVQNMLKTFGLDVIIYKQAQKMSQKLIAKVLNKTNGGSDSSPLFVENFGQYFENITRQRIDDYTGSLQSSNNPFARSIALGIDDQVSGFSAGGGLNSFSLDKYVPDGVNWQDAASDISVAGSKGWDFYSQLALPQNTPLGSAMIAQDQLAQNIKSAREFGKLELTSDGYLPMKDAGKNAWSSISSASGSGNFWSGFSSGAKKKDPPCTGIPCNYVPETEEVPGPMGPAENPNPPAETGDGSITLTGTGSGYMGGSGAETPPPETPGANIDSKIESPSETTKTNAGQANIEAFSRLRDADTFGKIIFGTISQMITGLIQKGIKNLESDGGSSAKLYNGPQDLSKLLNANTKNSWMRAGEQIVDLRNELDASITKTELEIDFIEQTIDITKKGVSNPDAKEPESKTLILDIEMCIPGPDTGWEQRLRDYQERATKETQSAGASGDSDDKKGARRNSSALTLIRQLSTQAAIEQKSLMSNPFLNMPASEEMKSALQEFYRLTKNFQTMFDTVLVKRQTLVNLQTIAGQAVSFAEKAIQAQPEDPNKPKPKTLILFDNQWDELSTKEKNDLYNEIAVTLGEDFPEYLDATATTTTQLKPLAVDDTTTVDNLETEDINENIDEHDEDMKKRVFDHQWGVWEQIVPDADKSKLYSGFIGLSRDLSDSASVQRAQVVRNGAETLSLELNKILRDCKKIREYIQTSDASTRENISKFKANLESGRIKDAFNNPSILNVPNNIDFNKLNERILSQDVNYPDLGFIYSGDVTSEYGPIIQSLDTANKLQVQSIPKTPKELIDQDNKNELFCRLTLYHLFFWVPKQGTVGSLDGKPIGCSYNIPPSIAGLIAENGWSPKKGNTYKIESFLAGGERSGSYKSVEANWYHTNNAEIFLTISDF